MSDTHSSNDCFYLSQEEEVLSVSSGSEKSFNIEVKSKGVGSSENKLTQADVNKNTATIKKQAQKIAVTVEKQAKRKEAAVEKQAKKQKLAEDKAARLAAIDNNKIYKPGECMKYMSIVVHPALHGAWYTADIAREAAAAGCKVTPAMDLCDPNLVMWNRTVPPTLTNDNGQVGLSSTLKSCNRALFVCLCEDIEELVSTHSLATRVCQLRDMAGCQLTLLLFGAKDYFKSTGRKTSNSNRKLMTKIDLEMAITDLLVTAGCDTISVNTPNELALAIIQMTKAIAEAPFKKAKREIDEQAEYYMRGDKRNCVALTSNGNGVCRLWQQMIAVLPHSSLETARALCAQYKSPQALYEALQAPDSISAVASTGVARSAAKGARARRVGPEFARRLHTLFTSTRGDDVIE